MDFIGAIVDEIALEGLDGMVKVMFVKYDVCPQSPHRSRVRITHQTCMCRYSRSWVKADLQML